MRSNLIYLKALALAAVLLMSRPLNAKPQKLAATGRFQLKVSGDSTFHKWEAQATQFELSGLRDTMSGAVSALSLTLSVDGLKSNEGVKMDKNLHAAMEAKNFASVNFSLKSYVIKGAEVTALGLLTIHGIAKDIEIRGQLASTPAVLNVKGSYELLMSDFGIKPPVIMLGTVRVRDKVSIAFDYDLIPLNSR